MRQFAERAARGTYPGRTIDDATCRETVADTEIRGASRPRNVCGTGVCRRDWPAVCSGTSLRRVWWTNGCCGALRGRGGQRAGRVRCGRAGGLVERRLLRSVAQARRVARGPYAVRSSGRSGGETAAAERCAGEAGSARAVCGTVERVVDPVRSASGADRGPVDRVAARFGAHAGPVDPGPGHGEWGSSSSPSRPSSWRGRTSPTIHPARP
jgi:hypothetical protein